MDKETKVEIVETEVLEKYKTTEDISIVNEKKSDLVPQMNVNVPATANNEEGKLFPDDKIIKASDEILNNLRCDRSELDELISQFKDMVLNGGDASNSSKEALVNLIKIKTDTADKMSKIVELMYRSRGVNTFPKYLAVNQNNTINNTNKKLSSQEKRALIEAENKKNKETK